VGVNGTANAQQAASEAAPVRFEPRITAFVCNWCTYAGADLTGTSRIKYQPNARVIRLPCTGRIDFMLVLKALAGADGVIVSGCHPNDCHYTSGNYHARRRWMVFRDLLDFAGVDVRRVTFAWVSAAEGAKWAELVNQVTDAVRELGPFEEYHRLAGLGIE
jgi:coenzyme F420-reducing hydrogenase delta subunit